MTDPNRSEPPVDIEAQRAELLAQLIAVTPPEVLDSINHVLASLPSASALTIDISTKGPRHAD